MSLSRSSFIPPSQGPVTLNIEQQQQLNDLVENLRDQLVREAEQRHQLAEWLSAAKTESRRLRSLLDEQQQRLQNSWKLSQRYEDELEQSVREKEYATAELSKCQAELTKAQWEIEYFDKWKSENISVDRAQLLQQIESLETQVKLAPHGGVQALLVEREDLKDRCSKLEKSLAALTVELREAQIQNDTILKTHVDELRDEKAKQQWYLMGGNPNDEVMKGARELRQLRVKSGADDKLKEELRGKVTELEQKLAFSEKNGEELRAELRERERHGPHLLPRSELQTALEEAHAASCKVYVENSQLRDYIEAIKSKAESYSVALEQEKMARDVAERQLRSIKREGELAAASDERRKILEKHHEKASGIALEKYRVAQGKYESLANLATESIAIGLVKVRLLRGRDGEEATPPEPRIVTVGQDRMLKIYANDMSSILVQARREDLKVMYIGSNSMDIETPLDGLFRFVYPNNSTAQLWYRAFKPIRIIP